MVDKIDKNTTAQHQPTFRPSSSEEVLFSGRNGTSSDFSRLLFLPTHTRLLARLFVCLLARSLLPSRSLAVLVQHQSASSLVSSFIRSYSIQSQPSPPPPLSLPTWPGRYRFREARYALCVSGGGSERSLRQQTPTHRPTHSHTLTYSSR